MLESPLLNPVPGTEHESQSSNVASPVQFIKEYIEQTLNTPPGFPVSVAAEHYKRQRLIEEIVESEVEYVQMLRILRNCFLDVLSINDYIPMKALNEVVTRMLEQHEVLCQSMHAIVDGSVKRFDESTELNWSDLALTSWDHLELCEQVARLLGADAVHVEQYGSYLQYYNQISTLLTRMGRESQDGLLFAILFRIELCLPKYYSHTSQQGYKRDFSFRAMIQMPINRIAKYRLFLESLVYLTENPSITDVKRLDDLECQALTHSIKSSLDKIFSVLQKVNEANADDFRDPTLALIQERLAFDLPDERIPIEAMGHCYTRGCLAVAWPCVDDGSYASGSYRKSRSRYFNNFYRTKKSLHIESDQLGVFLFKSYLVLAEIPPFRIGTPDQEWPIKFAIRLASCRILDPSSNPLEPGLHSEYENSIKIQFEYDFMLWEVLLFGRDAQELNSWREELKLFINEINGPHTFGVEPARGSVSQSTLESTLHFSDSTTFPDQMMPFVVYNESLSGRFDRSRSFKRRVNSRQGQSYEEQSIKVDVEFRKIGPEVSPSSTWFLRGSSSRLDFGLETSHTTVTQLEDGPPSITAENDPCAFDVVFSRWKRGQVELGMLEVWSNHLTRVGGISASAASRCAEETHSDDKVSSLADSPRATRSLRTLPHSSSEMCVPTTTASTPVRASTFRTTRWSIKRVFSRRRPKRYG